jgi:YebC/PmpR family DNA-binding regulatory protein
MGRAFEYRKATKLKRWGNMARVFTKLGKGIEMAVKEGGPDPTGNTRLRMLIQTAKSENMPKDNIDRAIKRATSKDTADYKEVIFEGYGPGGVAVLVETATDNNTRTVANVRNHFNKNGGTMGTSGSVAFMFDHKCTFKFVNTKGADPDELELEMIDLGVDEMDVEGNEISIEAPFESFGDVQKFLEDNGYEIISGEFVRLPTDTKDVTPEQRATMEKLIEKLEDDDDVTNVYHNMKEEPSA